MPTIDNWRALREALDQMFEVCAHLDVWKCREGEINEWGAQCYEIDCETYGIEEIATAYDPETAAYIAAAHPAAIRSLLDERDRLAAEVEALRGDVVVVIDGHNIRPADVLRRIIRNLKIKKGRTAWGVVSDLTAHGSTVSAGLCEWAGIEPDSGHRLTQP